MPVDVGKLQRRYEELKTERSGWDTAWSSLAELFLPTRWRSDTDETDYKKPKLNGRLVNSAGVLAMRTLAAGMQGGMTSPVRPWFRLTLAGTDQAHVPGMGAWLDEATEAMRQVLYRSNCYNVLHGLYADLGTFGTALLVETADEDGVHFDLVRAGEYVLDINGRGEVDTFYRRLFMTARQIVDRWGDGDNIPAAVKSAAQPGQSSSTRWNVIHAVFPRKDFDPSVRLGKEGKPYASVYFMNDGSQSGRATVLDEGGYDMFPAFAPRWDASGGDVYGRSPAMDVTPDCRMLQAMTATLRRMQHKIAAPPMVVDSSVVKYGVSLDPDALNFVDMATMAQSGSPVTPIHQPEPQALNFTMQGIRDVEQIVKDGLYTDLFRMLIDDDRRQITATEIQARQQEKLSLIGPVVERLIKELLEPLILRTYQLMRDWGALPPAPEGVELAELDVSFESVLAQAQRMTATSAIDQGLAFMVQAAQVQPDVLDVLDFDAMGKAYLDRIGMPESCMRDDVKTAAVRAQRARREAQAAQQQEAVMQARQAVDVTAAAKNLGQTPTGADGQTLMSSILGGLGSL